MRRLLLLVVLFPGCCWTAKRDCFPPCPPPEVVQIEKPCQLPDPLVLKPFKRSSCASQPAMICFEPAEAAALASDLDALKTWVARARARCGAPASLPSSLPSSHPK
jgi:hypothetical protein